MSRIQIIDDDRALCRSLQIQLEAHGHTVRCAHTAADGRNELEQAKPDLLFLDLKLPDGDGLDMLKQLEPDRCGFPIIMITGRQDTRATIEAMRAGAFDYLRKPFDFDAMLLAIAKGEHLSAAQAGLAARKPTASYSAVAEADPGDKREIVGSDPKIVDVLKQIGLLSRSRVTVLIEGESGTGKELAARLLHEAVRRDRSSTPGEPFVAINCSAIVGSILESELFGHEKGAFTSADSQKIGKLEFAGEGTVFLDEIADMPLELQAKLLRVLQEGEFERVGGLDTIPFRARVAAATNHDLESLVAGGRFRQDLFYRLAVSRLRLPPLRERRGDIRMLAGYLLGRIGRKLHRRIDAIDEDAMRSLESYDWPGNVRELENVLTRAAALAKSPLLTVDPLQLSPPPVNQPQPTSQPQTLREAEKQHILKALLAHGWNITHTARLLDISPTTLRKKISDYRLKKCEV